MATTTPLYNLVELSGIGAFASFARDPASGPGAGVGDGLAGQGSLIGVIYRALYQPSAGGRSGRRIRALNQTFHSTGGTLTIDRIDHAAQIFAPTGQGTEITVTYDTGEERILSGHAGGSEAMLIVARPKGGGAERYFLACDPGGGAGTTITAVQLRSLEVGATGGKGQGKSKGRPNPEKRKQGKADAAMAEPDRTLAPVCFAQGTLIDTPSGGRLIESLRVGDLVLTQEAGAQPIRWLCNRRMAFSLDNAAHRPILIKAGALGGGLPARDLVVSPQHKLLFSGLVVRAVFGEDQVLAVARGLTALAGIRAMAGKKQTRYYTLLLDQHHIVFAEGAPSESFYPSATALERVPAAQQAELLGMFPALRYDRELGYGSPACRLLNRRETEHLAQALMRPAQLPVAQTGAVRTGAKKTRVLKIPRSPSRATAR